MFERFERYAVLTKVTKPQKEAHIELLVTTSLRTNSAILKGRYGNPDEREIMAYRSFYSIFSPEHFVNSFVRRVPELDVKKSRDNSSTHLFSNFVESTSIVDYNPSGSEIPPAFIGEVMAEFHEYFGIDENFGRA